MKTSERHHLKDNELALAVGSAQTWYEQNRTAVLGVLGGLVLVGGGLLGYNAWRASLDAKAAAHARRCHGRGGGPRPAARAAGRHDQRPHQSGGQLPGTYPTLQAKLETALPKFMAAADAYPTSQPGQMARLHAAETLAQLGRRDEAIAQYDQLTGSSNALIARSARLGKSSVQLRAGQYDPAIATLKELAEQKDGALPAEALLMELARAYKLAGKTEDARKTLTQIVEQHADSPLATEAKAEIAKIKS